MIDVAIFALLLLVILLAVSRTMQHRALTPGRPIEWTDPAGRIVSGEVVEHAWISPSAIVRSDEDGHEYAIPLGRLSGRS